MEYMVDRGLSSFGDLSGAVVSLCGLFDSEIISVRFETTDRADLCGIFPHCLSRCADGDFKRPLHTRPDAQTKF